MKSIFLVSCLILSIQITSVHAEPQKIVVMGTEVLADNIGYFAGSKTIASFNVTNPVTFNFPRGNTVIARDTVYLHANGNVSLISSPAKLDLTWNTADGRKVEFDCGMRPATFTSPQSSRIITFYDNGEYRSGCSAYNLVEFKDANGNNVNVFGSLDVTPDFKLLYAQKVGDAYVKAGDAIVHLLPGSEVALYASGKPRFFTLIHGETFSIDQPLYGKIKFRQKDGKNISTSLFENGLIEMGIVDQSLTLKNSTIEVPAGAGVVFSEKTNDIFHIIFTIPAPIQAKGYTILASSFTLEDTFYTLFVAQEFNFKNPTNGLMILVPVGSQVALSKDMEIIGIKIPRKQADPVSPNDL